MGFKFIEWCCGILISPSSIEMVIKAPEAVIRQFLVVLLFLRGPGHNGAGVNISQNSPIFHRGKVRSFWKIREESEQFESRV